MWFRKPSLIDSVQRELADTEQAILLHAGAREYHSAMERMLLERAIRLHKLRVALTVHPLEPAPSVQSAPQTAG